MALRCRCRSLPLRLPLSLLAPLCGVALSPILDSRTARRAWSSTISPRWHSAPSFTPLHTSRYVNRSLAPSSASHRFFCFLSLPLPPSLVVLCCCARHRRWKCDQRGSREAAVREDRDERERRTTTTFTSELGLSTNTHTYTYLQHSSGTAAQPRSTVLSPPLSPLRGGRSRASFVFLPQEHHLFFFFCLFVFSLVVFFRLPPCRGRDRIIIVCVRVCGTPFGSPRRWIQTARPSPPPVTDQHCVRGSPCTTSTTRSAT